MRQRHGTDVGQLAVPVAGGVPARRGDRRTNERVHRGGVRLRPVRQVPARAGKLGTVRQPVRCRAPRRERRPRPAAAVAPRTAGGMGNRAGIQSEIMGRGTAG